MSSKRDLSKRDLPNRDRPNPDLPNIAEVVGPILERVLLQQRPLFVAIAERLAAKRYREWAEASKQASRRAALLACADREEEIAGRIEALYPDAAAIQRELLAGHPGLEDLNRSIFAERPLEEQYAIQAQGERIGASTWRSFAKNAEAAARETFLCCAKLEEQSATTLESILNQDC
jgi:hypothetical protein